MSGLNNLNKRLQYYGGNIEGRMNKDKLNALVKASKYAYQAETAILEDGREFKCLINKDKTSEEKDDKILSIPYKAICLNQERIGKTSEGLVDTNIAAGQTFTWKETDTHWLIYLHHLTESAYFLADIRRCDQAIEINKKLYWVYIRGPVEKDIEWKQKNNKVYNNLNYSLIMYITKDENTMDYFHRFSKIKIKESSLDRENTWEVTSVNPYYGDGIIQVFLSEAFENTIKEKRDKEILENTIEIEQDKTQPYIEGPQAVKSFDRATYKIFNISGGEWYLKYNNKEEFSLNSSKDTITIDITIGEIGNFILIYRTKERDITLSVKVEAF